MLALGTQVLAMTLRARNGTGLPVLLKMNHVGPYAFEATHEAYPALVGKGRTRINAGMDLFRQIAETIK